MIVIIDNYDSFTYNLYQYIGEIMPDIKIFRNDQVTKEELAKIDISHFIISPGPGFPKDSGISKDVVKVFGKTIPVLGVCLGHEVIGEAFGGKIVHANSVVHGKVSEIVHNGESIYQGLENPLIATRYHSLIVDKESLPKELEIMAETKDGQIMGIRHKKYPVYGVQFHPESILTRQGKRLLANFLKDRKG